MNGAGGTRGGVGHFWLGLAMMCGGFYMLFKSIMVYSSFSMSYQLYGFNLFGRVMPITSGMIMLPFIFGIGMVFFNAKNILGWILTIGSLVALLLGVIAAMHFSLASMSAFDLILILVMAFGGLGLFLKSLTPL